MSNKEIEKEKKQLKRIVIYTILFILILFFNFFTWYGKIVEPGLVELNGDLVDIFNIDGDFSYKRKSGDSYIDWLYEYYKKYGSDAPKPKIIGIFSFDIEGRPLDINGEVIDLSNFDFSFDQDKNLIDKNGNKTKLYKLAGIASFDNDGNPLDVEGNIVDFSKIQDLYGITPNGYFIDNNNNVIDLERIDYIYKVEDDGTPIDKNGNIVDLILGSPIYGYDKDGNPVDSDGNKIELEQNDFSDNNIDNKDSNTDGSNTLKDNKSDKDNQNISNNSSNKNNQNVSNNTSNKDNTSNQVGQGTSNKDNNGQGNVDENKNPIIGNNDSQGNVDGNGNSIVGNNDSQGNVDENGNSIIGNNDSQGNVDENGNPIGGSEFTSGDIEEYAGGDLPAGNVGRIIARTGQPVKGYPEDDNAKKKEQERKKKEQEEKEKQYKKIYVDDKDGNYADHKDINIFKNKYLDGLIAPGVHGEYYFAVHNESTYKAEYFINMTEKMDDKVNMKYRLRKNGTYIIGNESEWVDASKLTTDFEVIGAKVTDKFALEWKWFDDDENDIIAGKNHGTYSLGIDIYFQEVV